jgi:hypothetical protein
MDEGHDEIVYFLEMVQVDNGVQQPHMLWQIVEHDDEGELRDDLVLLEVMDDQV